MREVRCELNITQGHQVLDTVLRKVLRKPRAVVAIGHGFMKDGRQQLAVKVAESVVEELLLDWVRVDLQRLALQGQNEDAPALFVLHTSVDVNLGLGLG